MRSNHLTLIKNLNPIPQPISVSEKLADHNAILQGYWDTYITRNYADGTLAEDRRLIEGWFKDYPIKDSDFPDQERHLLVWEAMTPIYGRQRIVEFSKGLAELNLKHGTRIRYVGTLKRFFRYVLDYPYVPRSGHSIETKYGRIEQPVLEYDYPLHADDPEPEEYVLTGDQLLDFYDFIRLDYIRNNQKKIPASRDYTMIVIAGESGLRASEINHLDAQGSYCDLFPQQNKIRTRYGKGFHGSGKRVRHTIFTPFAQSTVQVYLSSIRPKFIGAKDNPALFLTETGSRMSYTVMAYGLKRIANAARQSGIKIPYRFTWHSLRRSFATNYVERFPDKIWVLMDYMGHVNPSTLHRYVKHSRAYYESALSEVVSQMFMRSNLE